ncbi:DUF2155 domain-containing protein [Roseomonas xinghualingensis]|uniref:DUF2155 domain-containing protein n=1 Tax=Roseomonas xinghualingensis TaxID=2986475 RepID=UPI0021F1EFDC|nr:DUF2155 domain-containing protein [Roseomonas sp. SXEYE001]MCV4207123.1 DUF2155 domain-containing protein [Roseomonas sp. SXEYE001]
MRRAAFLLALLLSGPTAAQDMNPDQAPLPEAGWVQKRTAQLQALDKVTARITVLDATVGQPTRFGTLTITVRACNARPPDEVPDAAAFIEVRDDLIAATSPPAFRGWMLANAPAANMLEHPVYDLRILECR